jgi:hypothetical protein
MPDNALAELPALPKRIADKISVSGDCWVWNGCACWNGYGRVSVAGKAYAAHRYVYAVAKGEIPAGLQIDHLCRNRLCVNPAHLEAVTPRENVLRSTAPEATRARHKSQTHCKRGHPLFGDNVRLYRGVRYCRACSKMHTTAWREQNIVEVRRRDRDRRRVIAAAARHDILAEIERVK